MEFTLYDDDGSSFSLRAHLHGISRRVQFCLRCCLSDYYYNYQARIGRGEPVTKIFWVLFSPSWLVVFGIYGDHVAVALILSLTSLFFVIQLYTLRNGIELICNYMKLKVKFYITLI